MTARAADHDAAATAAGKTPSADRPVVPVGPWPVRVVHAALHRPVLLWTTYLTGVTVLAVVARRLAPTVLAGPHGLSPLQVTLQLLITLAVVPFAAAVGAPALGLVTRLRPRHVAVLAFPLTTVAVGYLGGLRDLPVPTVLLAIASVALAGLGEELTFRGVLLHVLMPRGAAHAVIVSSMLFGLMHVANLALGASWSTTMLQVVFAAMAGAGYAAMRLRTGSLWPPVVLHAAYDATFRLAEIPPGSPFQYSLFMLHGVGWLLYAVVVLRPGPEAGSPGPHRGWLSRLSRDGASVLVRLPVALVSGTVLVSGMLLGGALAVTVVGPRLAVGTLALATRLATIERRRLAARSAPWAQPVPGQATSPRGRRGRLTDRGSWAAWLHGVGALPLSTVTWSIVVTWCCGAVASLTYWAWQPLAPHDGSRTTLAQLLGVPATDAALCLAVGCLLITTLPTVVRCCAAVHAAWARTLLAGSGRSAGQEPSHEVLVDERPVPAQRLPS